MGLYSEFRKEAKRVKDSQYEISYYPWCREQHYLHIRVEDNCILGSPFPLSLLTTTNYHHWYQTPMGLSSVGQVSSSGTNWTLCINSW